MSFLDSSQSPWNINNSNSIYRLLSGANKTSRMLRALNGDPFYNVNQMLYGHNQTLRNSIGGLYRVLEDIKRSNDNFAEYYNDLNKSLGDVLEKAFPDRATNEKESASFKVTQEIFRESISSIYGSSTSEEKIEIDSLLSTATDVLEVSQTADGITIFLDRVKEIVVDLSNNKNLSSFIKARLIAILDGLIIFFITAALSSNTSSESQIGHYQTKVVEVQQVMNNAILDMLPVVTATTAVHIRTRPNKKSKSLLLVQEGQDVKVIEEKYKWIYVSVKDEGDCFIEGWTYKEYFE